MFETTYIKVSGNTVAYNSVDLTSSKSYNFAGYSNLIVTIKKVSSGTGGSPVMEFIRQTSGSGLSIGEVTLSSGSGYQPGNTYDVPYSLADLQLRSCQ